MTKRRVLAVLVALAMLIGGLPVSGLEANAAQKHCKNSDDCIVCTIAEMINDLPDAEDIDVYNAAAVVEQIHAIDRIKGELSDDEYEEMLDLIDTIPPKSGFGMDISKKYEEAVDKVTSLNAGGSLYITKKYSVEEFELDWTKTDATVKIEALDEGSSFEPLSITLGDIDVYNSPFHVNKLDSYNMESDGWTNKYILPAGTYKITETGYHAVTEDGDKLATTATYDVDGEELEDYAIVAVKNGEDNAVTVMNGRAEKYLSVDICDSYGNTIDGASLTLTEVYGNNEEYTINSGNGNYLYVGEYTMKIEAPAGYIVPNLEDAILGLRNDENVNLNNDIDGISVGYDSITIKLNKESSVKIAALVVDSDWNEDYLSGVKLGVYDKEGNEVATWTSGTANYVINKLIADEEYTIKVISVPEGYYYEGEDEIEFSVDGDGYAYTSANTDEEGCIQIEFNEFIEYYVPLLPKNLLYGEPFGGNILDLANITKNGQPFSNPHFGQSVYIECTDADGNKYETKDGAVIPVGTYKAAGKPAGETTGTKYTFGNPVDVIVAKRPLTSSDINSVTVKDKEYDGTKTAEAIVIFKNEDPQNGYNGGMQINGANQFGPIYDKVTAIVTAEFEDAKAGTDKTVTYTVTGLEGAAAKNYELPDGGIKGATTGTITKKALTEYYIPVLAKERTVEYGDKIGTFIDINNITMDGEPTNYLTGMPFSTLAIDENGNKLSAYADTVLPVGKYKLTGEQTGSFENSLFTFGEMTLTVAKRALDKDDFTVSAKDKDYDGTTDVQLEVKAKDSVLAADVAAGKVTIEIDGEFESVDAGKNKEVNYTITLKGANASNYDVPAEGIKGSTSASIIATVEKPVITFEGTKDNGKYTSDVTVKIESATSGATIYYTIDGSDPATNVDGRIKYNSTFEVTGEEGTEVNKAIRAIAVKTDMKDSETVKEDLEIAVPDESPTVEITVKNNAWNTLLNTVTFNKFFKETQKAIIKAEDNYSGIAKVEYCVSEETLDEAGINNIAWSVYDASFNLVPNAKAIIYAKATDKAGNVAIVNSEGIVLYTDSTVSESSYEYTQDINMDLPEIKVTLNGNTINSVLNGNEVVDADKYTVDGNGTIAFDREYLDSLEGGVQDITVMINPMGEQYPRMRSTNEAPENLSIKLNIIDTKKNDNGTVSADNNGDGDFDDPEDKTYIPEDTDGDGTPDEFTEVKPNDDGSYTDENGTPNDPSDDKTYIPVDKDNDGKVDDLIEVKPNDDGTYSDDANGDGKFGGDGDNKYKSNGNGLFVVYKDPVATETGDDFDLLFMMTIMLITLATMTVVAYVGRRRTQ